jgi:ribosomal protein S18 acetylase RimI-like enzyme
MFAIVQAENKQQIEQARLLFQEYAESLGFSLCFQSSEQELAGLPGDYAPPAGRLLVAYADSQPAGCVALHRFHAQAAEMKRLYVRPEFRGRHLGQMLLDRVVAEARVVGYKSIRLDTVPSVMSKAVEMYKSYGFREIAPYRANPIEGALYMELELVPLVSSQ